MKEKRLTDDFIERILRGIFLGLVLFTSAVLVLCFQNNIAEIGKILPYVPVAFLVYILLGIVFVWLHERVGEGQISSWFKGSAAVYWCDLFMLVLFVPGFFLSDSLRYIILVNEFVLIGCWILDYCFVLSVAKELNHRKRRPLYLVVDLEECPKGEEAFCREIEDYCRKNRMSLEFVNRGKPADVMMNGEAYHVELDMFYSQFGPMYALKFRQDSSV